MIEVIDDSFMVCEDCCQYIVNDDLTGLDHSYSEEEAEAIQFEIQEGLARLEGYVSTGDADKNDDFSTKPCDCCGSKLHGARYHFVVLKDTEHG